MEKFGPYVYIHICTYKIRQQHVSYKKSRSLCQKKKQQYASYIMPATFLKTHISGMNIMCIYIYIHYVYIDIYIDIDMWCTQCQ